MSRLTAILLMIVACVSIKAQDVVILTSGDELEGKVVQSGPESVAIDVKKSNGLFGSSTSRATIDASKIYMIKYKERGNVYFKTDGSRVSGEKQKIDKNADIVYLVDGAELPAYGLEMNSDGISFRTTKDKKKARSAINGYKLSEVFMIIYSDGSRDIITSLDKPKEPAPAEESQPTEPEPQFKIVFHNTKAGDTLKNIAEKYGVTVDELREWNELDEKLKETTRLKTGMQLLIQQPITDNESK